MIYGYARVSTTDQDLAAQIGMLRDAGAVRVYSEKVSGARGARPELEACLDDLDAGDTMLVVSVSRLGRSMKQLIDTIDELGRRGIHLKSLTEGFDTSTPGGELLFNVLGAVAQWERQMIVERTNQGLAAARAKGRVGGRRRIMTKDKQELACKLFDEGNNKTEVARMLGVGWTSVHRAIEERADAEDRADRLPTSRQLAS